MKIIFTFLLLPFFCISQSISDYKKYPMKDCDIFKGYDAFDKKTTYRTNFISISQPSKISGRGNQTLQLMMFKTYQGEEYQLLAMFMGSVDACKDEKSYVDILFNSGEKLTIYNAYSEIKCGSSYIAVYLSKEDVATISTNKIDKIRLKYSDASDDFDITQKGYEKTTKYLNCLSSL